WLRDYLNGSEISDDDRQVFAAALVARQYLADTAGAAFWTAAASAPDPPPPEVTETYDTADLNRDLRDGVLTADLDVHLVEGTGLTWAMTREAIDFARAVYAGHAIQLRVRSARRLRVP